MISGKTEHDSPQYSAPEVRVQMGVEAPAGQGATRAHGEPCNRGATLPGGMDSRPDGHEITGSCTQWPAVGTRRLGFLPLLMVLVHACGYNPTHNVGQDGGDARAVIDGVVDATTDPAAMVETDRDVPIGGFDGTGTIPPVDATAGVDGQVGHDASMAPDALVEPDVPVVVDSAGGATASGGSSPATGGSSTGGSTSTGGTSSTVTGGTAAGGTGGVSTGGVPSTGGTSQATLWSNCQLLLHMDEPAWNGTAGEVSDASGAGNPGTANGGANTTNMPAKLGRAGLFLGSGYVSVPDSATLHAGNGFSVSAWIYPTALDGSSAPGIISKRHAYGSGTEFAVFVWTGNRVFVDVDGEADRFESTGVLNNNTWYHVAVVFDGSADPSERVRLYLNGQLDTVHAETSSTVTPSSAAVEIGNLPNGGDPFIGAIDEVAFWRRSLSAAEVLSLSR